MTDQGKSMRIAQLTSMLPSVATLGSLFLVLRLLASQGMWLCVA